MDCAALQSRSEAGDAEVFSPKHDGANGSVVRQHADDDLAIEEIGDVRCGHETERSELGRLIRATDICNHR